MKIVALFCAASVLLASSAQAGQFLLDFNGDGANSAGAAAGWDAFNDIAVNQPYTLTDRSGGGDNDVTLTAVDDSFSPNNPAGPGTDFVFDGIAVPKEAVDDYLFKTDDTAGTTARLRIDNLDAGVYNVTLFEGRTTDPSQFAKLWVGDDSGSGIPASENTGNFAQGSSTVQLAIGAGDTLWYQHLEDNTGGISGMIINQVPEPSSLVLVAVGLMSFGLVRRRR
ncbi:MAG: PEP-CTERM sorting domain-containing protein [Planctomycetales bacterium]|nr:PEP-CTERM sorting domain-containing protein [Planctomycetales bacterium]